MSFLSVNYRITFGLVTILMSTTLLVVVSGFGPDARQATMRGRKRLCEAIAVNSSIYVSRNDLKRMEKTLAVMVERDEELLSAGVRRADGQVIVEISNHSANWQIDAERSTETQVTVPLWSGKSKWGAVELCFRPVTLSGFTGLLYSPWTIHMVLVGALSFATYSFYLRMVLRQLNPSQAIPKRVRSALDALAEGLLVTDRTGRVVLANESFAGWAGQESDKLIGCDAAKFPWESAGSDLNDGFPWDRALQEQVPQAGHLLELIDGEGNHLTLIANSSPVLGHDGKYRGVLTSFEDVTELEQHKVELTNAKQAADDANQAKSEFLARMSHEIRTPMNAILGYTDILRRGFVESPKERDNHLRTIHNSGEHLLALINDILDLSKVEAGRLELELDRHSPTEIVSQVMSVLKVKAQEKGLTLEYETVGKLPATILTDAVRLRQAIINLVGNAIKFTEAGGVRVVARLIHEPSTLVAFDVIDTGIGMSEDALNRVFDPFSQADTSITRRYGGTGLGLSISLQLAEQMGGGVNVDSELGSGTTFTLTIDPGPLDDIPLVEFADEEFENCDQPDQQPAQVSLPPSHVLVVDDGEENRQLVSLFLSRVGVDVSSAENGQVAVEMASANDFDAILMDMQMPVMDGLTATRRLRELGCTTPILALTANVMKDDERKCREAGCDGFLTKPINLDRLLESLGDTLAENSDRPTRSSRAARPVEKPGSPSTIDSYRRFQTYEDNVESDEMLHVTTPIRSSLPTDDPQFQTIVDGFVGRLRERVREMRQAATAGDLAELAELAHWLKGAGGSIGFDVFTKPAAALQSSAEAGAAEEAAEQLRVIEALTERIQAVDYECLDPGQPTSAKSNLVEPLKGNEVDEYERVRDAVTELSDEVHSATLIRSSLPTDDPQFQTIVDGFVGRLKERVREMRQAATAGDLAELAELAHWLKGAGGSIGFDVFTKPAAALQSSAEARAAGEAAEQLTVIERLTARIQVVEPEEESQSPTTR